MARLIFPTGISGFPMQMVNTPYVFALELNVLLDWEQSLLFFRFRKRSARARERRDAKRGRAISHARGHLRVPRFAQRTTEKRETARSLMFFQQLVC